MLSQSHPHLLLHPLEKRFSTLWVFFGLWNVAKESLSADKSKNCLFWKQSDKERRFDGIYPGLGMYAQYYVYGKKFMIDEEGEYAFEEGKLYIKWSKSSLPNTLEF